MLSFRTVFVTEFCFGRLPQMAATKQLFSFYSAKLFCFGFDLNQSQGAKPISKNSYGPY